MDRDGRYFFLGGIAAIAFYLALAFLLILFFNDYRHNKRYVPKQTQSVQVFLAMSPPVKTKPVPHTPISKPTPKKAPPKPKTKPVVKKASHASSKKASRPRPVPIASLFKGIKVDEPVPQSARLANAPRIKYRKKSPQQQTPRRRAEELVKDINLTKPSITMRSKASGQGEVDAYMSKLYGILYGSWHPAAIYAGSTATVRLKIAPDGSFSYRLLYPSDNQGFNERLIEYLDGLQRSKLPSHKRDKTLVIDVEFKAKE